MAQKKAHEVERFLARKDAHYPIVLVYGPDKGLVFERAQKFAKVSGASLDDPFATIRLDANDIDRARLDDETRTMALFGGDRLIWVKNAANQKNLVEAIKHLITEPPQNCFVLIEAGDLKKGTGLRGLVEASSSGMALPCYSDDANSIGLLIDQMLDQFNLAITLDARKFLRNYLGGDRLASRAELEKLCLYALGHREITLEDVLQSVSDVGHLSQDEVVDAILVGDVAGFNDKFNRQLAANIPLFTILSATQRLFLQLQLMRYNVEVEGKTPYAAVASSRPPVFFKRQKIVERALSHWTLERIARALEKLQNTVLQSRKFAELNHAIVRQTLLALAVDAAKAARAN